MKDMPKIAKIEVHQFEFQVGDIEQDPTYLSREQLTIGRGSHTVRANAIRLFTDLEVISWEDSLNSYQPRKK